MPDRLTPRQKQIKERLDQEMGAREIAKELGITRNAVYQQIQALRRKGELERDFTPSGLPAREPGVMFSDSRESLVAVQSRKMLETAHELRRLADEIEAFVG